MSDELERRVAGLEARLAVLEARVVMRNGPLVDELKANTRGLERLQDKMASRDELQAALQAQTQEIAQKKEQGLTRKEKYVAAAVGIALLTLNALHAAGIGH